MKIVRVETLTVVVPLHEGSWHSPQFEPEGYSYGGAWVRLHWPEFPIVIIKLHTDEGLVGLGEVPKGVSADNVHAVAGRFEGQDLWSLNLQELPLETMWFANSALYEGYEMALFDLVGKALGVPVYRLFGGKYRDRVAVSRCSGRMTPDDAARTAKEVVAQGYNVLKMKATADDPLVERLGAIQDAVGDKLHVVVDPNQRFHQPFRLFEIDDALRAAGIRNVQCYESPFDQRNLDWYVLARQKLTVPIALHLGEPRPVVEAIKREACDWLNTGGPMVNTYKLAGLAEAAGVPTWHGSGVGLGISEAAYTHVSAACRSMVLTSDICGETLRVNDLIREPLVIRDGHVCVPEGPGLGVELDEDAVDRFRVA
ncbi:MAG: muconate cycloisomerase [Thermomicrobiales bacterium]|jgi:muconate cycloisomerase|nr:muconate cycloisomerase [Thermomicrobiales bacterium]